MSEVENHWAEVRQIETQLMRHFLALGVDWQNEMQMQALASECKNFGPQNAQSAYAAHDARQVTRAELFGLVSIMVKTMESAAKDERDVHGGPVWKAFAKHLY